MTSFYGKSFQTATKSPASPYETNGKPEELRDVQGRKLCGAKKRSGGVCRAKAMANGRCRLHGGATPSGPASPHWVNGKHSKMMKALPVKLRKSFLEILSDPTLHSLDENIALLDTRTIELLKALARAKGERASEIWAEIQEITNTKRSAAATEHRRHLDLSHSLTADQLAAFITIMMETLVDVARTLIDDEKLANQVISQYSRRVQALVQGRNQRVIEHEPGVSQTE